MKSILVVDDDFSMRKGVSLLLRGQGFVVHEAIDAGSALEILDEKIIDLAILDLFLPGIDGLDLSKMIAERFPEIKIIIMSAHPEHDRAAEARNLYHDSFIEKMDIDGVLIRKTEEQFSLNDKKVC